MTRSLQQALALRRRSPLRLVIRALIALSVSSCASARYEPTIPMRTFSDDVALDLKFLRLGRVREFVYETESTLPHSIERAWLTVPTRAPCSRGAEADFIVVDGARDGTSWLPPGRHELRAGFDEQVSEFPYDVVMDFALEGGGCLRAPAISQSIPLAPRKRPVIVGGFGIDATSDLMGLRGLYAFQIGGGGWLGPVLLTGQVGIGQSSCNSGTCGKMDNGALKASLTFPLEASARYSLDPVTFGNMISIPSVGVRYLFAPIQLPAMDGEKRIAVHAVQGVVGWGLSFLRKVAFTHIERGPLIDMTIPIGVMFDSNSSSRVAFVAGVGMRWVIPL